MKKKILRVFALVAAITAIAAFSSGCGNSSGSGGDGGSGGAIVVETTGEGRKIVREIGVDIEADKGKTSDATSGILALLASAGGSVTDRYTSDYSSYSYVRLTLKIPSDKVDSFVSSLKDSYNVVNSREKTTDVTEKYNAYKAQLTGLKQKKTIYDGLYADEKATVADKLVILDKLEELNKAIGQAEEQTSPYEGLGSYATVNVYISAQESDAAGIALTVIFGAVIPIALAVALIVVGVKLSDAKKKLKQTQKSDE